jgi:broad specificity phosphatase PhoE
MGKQIRGRRGGSHWVFAQPSMSERTSLLLVRSGLTDWDCQGRVQGCADLPLCEAGRKAAQADCSSISSGQVGLVLCGPDDACKATAGLVAMRFPDAKIKTVKGLADPSLGLWEGQREEELEVRYGSVYRAWKDDPASIVPPDAEPLEKAQARILKALSSAIGSKTSLGIAIVLRPMALALLRTHVRNEALTAVWEMVEKGPCVEWLSVKAADLRYRTTLLGTR